MEPATTPAVIAAAGWTMNLSPVEVTVPQGAVQEGVGLLERWAKLFPGKDTWVWAAHSVPSLITRIDGIVDDAGSLKCYEIEERPCGIGITANQQPRFRGLLASVMSSWPSLRWVSCKERPADDELWLGAPLSLAEARTHTGQLLVRSRPEQVEYHELEDRAVSSVSAEGDKAYGEVFGWWRKLTLAWDAEERAFGLSQSLPDPCILKPLRGTRSRFVRVFASVAHRERLRERGFAINSKDCDSVSQIVKLMRTGTGGAMYCQPLIEPMRLPHEPGKNAIVRIFYGYDLRAREWVPLGGVWMALDSLIVHGTDRTVTGPLALV